MHFFLNTFNKQTLLCGHFKQIDTFMLTILTNRHFYVDTFKNKTLLKCSSSNKLDIFNFLDTLKVFFFKSVA